MKFIETFREGMHVSDVYLCKTKQIALTKNGKEYGSLNLQDKTGTVDAKIWELNSPGINEFSAMDYVFVDADVTVFQGQFQLNVKRIRRADENEYRPSDYLPVTAKDVKTMHHELVQYITTIRNENLRKLAAGFFMNDAAFIKEFCAHSAAKSVHHSFVGGLLEHTLSVVKMCDYFCKQYSALNRDLLLTAAMFHEIGKTKELSSFPENDYTDEGQLVGHIIIGAQMVTEQIRTIPGFPKKLENELKQMEIDGTEPEERPEESIPLGEGVDIDSILENYTAEMGVNVEDFDLKDYEDVLDEKEEPAKENPVE